MNTIKLNSIGLDDVIVKKVGSGGGDITIDASLSSTSTNPVQNKVITNALNAIGGGGAATMIETTWEELKALRDGGQLNAGAMYRITDYETMTSKGGSQSAGHLFDLVVTALSASELDEKCSAVHSARDTEGYFANSNLNAWDVRYCLDNDTDRFDWAVVSGKSIGVDLSALGVGIINATLNGTFVYNDTTYSRWDTSISQAGTVMDVYVLTPSEDVTIGSTPLLYLVEVGVAQEAGTITSVIINENDGKGVIYRMIDEWNNDVPYDFKNIQFKRNDTWCYTFTSINEGNLLDESFNTATSNVFGVKCWDNVFLGENSDSGLFGNSCNSNTFGYNCNSNTFGYNCYSNSFGDLCTSNSFGNDCRANSFGNSCISNTFGNDCNYNSFGNECNYNSLGEGCISTTFGNGCSSNSLGESCRFNTFGNSCNYNSFRNNAGRLRKYYFYNSFGDGCEYINLLNDEEEVNSFNRVQNYRLAQGLKGTSSSPITITTVRNRAYETKVAKNSAGEVKIYCEADLVQ